MATPMRQVIPENSFLVEINDPNISSPNFTEVKLPKETSDVILIWDSATNTQVPFSSGLIKYDKLEMKRPRDGSAMDNIVAQFINATKNTGKKYDITVTQYRFNQEVMKVVMVGCLFSEYDPSELKTSSEEASMQGVAACITTMTTIHTPIT